MGASPEPVDAGDGTFPGARPPDRVRTVDSSGITLSVKEWGDPDAPPIAVAHGGFDFARTYDVFAPMLAEAGWRVVAWDQRGHGDSDHAHLYSWEADLRDAATVIDSVSLDPMPFLGHSKGGSLMMHLANAVPYRLSAMVNLDGIPSHRNMSDVSDHERKRMVRRELELWLDHRKRAATKQRRPGTIQELAERRGRMNPRLSVEWLRHLVTVGARHDADGWRWKIDPTLRLGGFGPWRPEWSMARLPGIAAPVLAVLGAEPELMGWGTQPEDVLPILPAGAVFRALDGVGHFVHIEQPRLVADMVLDFLS